MRKEIKRKVNKYAAEAQPQAQFDFHGQRWQSQQVIKEAVDEFVVECREKGFKKILIITGKGLHSENGPVVKPIVEGYLRSRSDVKSVVDAPMNQGGGGALLVVLNF
jgi:DNA-nicking Smr family endonuclease